MGLGTLITRTTDTVVAATTSAARAVTAATTSAAGATGGAALGAGLGAVRGAGLGAVRGAADGLRDGAERGSRSAPAAALTVTALTVTGILDWPLVLAAGGTAFLVNRLTQHPAAPPHPPATPTTPHPPTRAARKTRTPRSPAAAGRRPPAATPHLHLHLPRRRNSRLASGLEPPGHGGGAGRVAHGEFSCSDRSWVASLTIRPALTPCRTPRTHPAQTASKPRRVRGGLAELKYPRSQRSPCSPPRPSDSPGNSA